MDYDSNYKSSLEFFNKSRLYQSSNLAAFKRVCKRGGLDERVWNLIPKSYFYIDEKRGIKRGDQIKALYKAYPQLVKSKRNAKRLLSTMRYKKGYGL